jgi:pimeloyl-ACP methyl ester carboxylesterase
MAERTVTIGEVEICFETLGDPSGRPLLLIMGLGGPLIWWDDQFCRLLVDRGFHVIRYDNRDCGRSQRMTGRANVLRAYLRAGARAPYSLDDMADDAAGLLDDLGIAQAHVTGVSMGGMIAQSLAIRHPDRVASLVSISSTTGARRVGWTDPRLLRLLFAQTVRTREEYLALAELTFRRIGSPSYPFSAERLAARASATYERGLNRAGTLRQIAALLSARDRSPELRRLKIPALVIHGTVDPLVHVSGGRATARAIPGAELMLVPGMGHDLPPELWPLFVEGIERTADRAASASATSPSTTSPSVRSPTASSPSARSPSAISRHQSASEQPPRLKVT